MGKIFFADKETQDITLAYCKQILEAVGGQATDSKSKVAAQYFNLRRTGNEFGVKWPAFATSPLSAGTRTRHAVGKVAYPSTEKTAARNDFDTYSIFNGLRVNGHVDANGEFIVDFFEGEEGFSNTENDTWILHGTHWFVYDFTDGEELAITDKPKKGWCPEGAAIRPDGTIRPFVAIAAYAASKGKDGKIATVAGNSPMYNVSHNTGITECKKKGTQYCITTQQDQSHLNDLFLVAFATRDTQSIMAGHTKFGDQYTVTVAESNVERVIVTSAQANSIVVGSCVSVGDPTTNSSKDRGQAYMHSLADRVVVTKIEDLGGGNGAIYVDNKGVKFSTTATTVVSVMPWHTGSLDNVLGTCGSIGSNTNGKSPYKLFGVECSWGQYEVIGNTVMKITNGVMKPYICYDCTKLSSSAPTSDYEEVDIVIPNSQDKWQYISELGYDAKHPTVRYVKEYGATSTTGYADAVYTENMTESTNGSREILSCGHLDSWDGAGRFFAALDHGLGTGYWYSAARISASGRCGKAAA